MAIYKDYIPPNKPAAKPTAKPATTSDAFWLGKTPHDHRVTFNQVCELIAWRGRLERKEPLGNAEKLNLDKLLANRGNEF